MEKDGLGTLTDSLVTNRTTRDSIISNDDELLFSRIVGDDNILSELILSFNS